jgi:hypothetical protein
MEPVDQLTKPAIADLGGRSTLKWPHCSPANLGGQPGRPRHVDERHGAQEPVGAGQRPQAGDEFLDGVQHLIGVADEAEQVGLGELEVLGAGDVISQVARVVRGKYGEHSVARSGDDQGRHLDGGQDAAHVDVVPLPGHRHSRGRAGRQAPADTSAPGAKSPQRPRRVVPRMPPLALHRTPWPRWESTGDLHVLPRALP